MAETQYFNGANAHYGPPPGLEEMIGWLHCFKNGNTVVSAWKPSAEELEKLNNGEMIFISIMSGEHVIPCYVGCEESCKAVVSDTGKVW